MYLENVWGQKFISSLEKKNVIGEKTHTSILITKSIILIRFIRDITDVGEKYA